MQPLDNQRHELFAQALAEGMSADAAYIKAGFLPHSGNASRLRGNESVQKRVKELQQRAAAKTEITVSQVLDALSDIGFAEISEVNGMKVSTKDRLSALEKIGKHLAMFVERTDHTSSDGSMTPKAPASVDSEVVDKLIDKLTD